MDMLITCLLNYNENIFQLTGEAVIIILIIIFLFQLVLQL